MVYTHQQPTACFPEGRVVNSQVLFCWRAAITTPIACFHPEYYMACIYDFGRKIVERDNEKEWNNGDN